MSVATIFKGGDNIFNLQSGEFAVLSPVPSTDTQTGALTVVGGCAIAGDLHVGGHIFGGSGFDPSQTVLIANTTQATNQLTGALQVAGGVGIQKDLFCENMTGANITIENDGELYFQGTQFKNDKIVLYSDFNDGYRFCGLGIQQYETRLTIQSALSHFSIYRGNIGSNTEIFRVEADYAKGTTIYNTASSTSYDTGALVVSGGVGIQGDTNTSGTLTVHNTELDAIEAEGGGVTTQTLRLKNYGSPTPPTIQMVNGSGTPVAQMKLIGDDLNISNSVGVVNLDATDVVLSGNLDASKVNTTLSYNYAYGYGTTDASNYYTGSLHTNGGASVVGNLYVGGQIYGTLHDTPHTFRSVYPAPTIILSGDNGTTYSNMTMNDTDPANPILEFDCGIHMNSTIPATNVMTGAMHVDGGASISGDTYIGGVLHCVNTTPSTDTATGAVIVSGGLAVGGDVNVSGKLTTYDLTTKNLVYENVQYVTSTANATDTQTGALIVAGGGSISKDLYVGGDIHATGSIPAPSLTENHIGYGDNSDVMTSSTQYVIDNNDANASKLKVVSPNGNKTTQLAADQLWDVGQLYTNASTLEGWANGTKVLSATSGNINVVPTTQSTNTVSGALTVAGGLGVAGNTNIGGITKISDVCNCLSTTQSTDTQTGALTVAGGLGVSGNTNIGGIAKISDVCNCLSTSQSTDTQTGALTVAGGLGVAGDMYIAGNIHTPLTQGWVCKINNPNQSISGDNNLAFYDTATVGALGINSPNGSNSVLISANQSTATSTIRGTDKLNIDLAAGAPGVTRLSIQPTTIALSHTTQSTNNTTGALTVAGGLGVVGNLNIGGNETVPTLSVTSTTQSTNTSTGAMTVAGGLGIGKDLRVGGTIYGTLGTAPSLTYRTVAVGDTNNLLSGTFGLWFEGIGGGINQLSVSSGSDLQLQAGNSFSTINSTGATHYIKVGAVECQRLTSTLNNMSIRTAISDTTESTSASTGCFNVAGGVGVAKNVNCAGTVLAGAYGTYAPSSVINVFDNDGTLANNSDNRLVTQKAIRTFVASQVTGAVSLPSTQIAYGNVTGITSSANFTLTSAPGSAQIKVQSPNTLKYVNLNVDQNGDSCQLYANTLYTEIYSGQNRTLTLSNTPSTSVSTLLAPNGTSYITQQADQSGNKASILVNLANTAIQAGSTDIITMTTSGVTVTATTNTTATNSGSLIVAGGLGVAKCAAFGGCNIYNVATFDVTGSTTWNDINIPICTYVKIIGSPITNNTQITGIANGVHGRFITLYAYNSTNVTLQILDENAGSSAQNRILTNTGATVNIQLNTVGSVGLMYDANILTGRWVMLSNNP